jgi:hypothetical protein
MSVHIFGVRHHGPGCARALRAALEELQPDALLVEGPPDAQEALALLPNAAMKPPVALLLYVPDAPQRAVYYPFTHFSPEWQALSYALGRGIPARFMDLPQANQLANEPPAPEPGTASEPPTDLPAAAESTKPHTSAGARFPAETAIPAVGASGGRPLAGRRPRSNASSQYPAETAIPLSGTSAARTAIPAETAMPLPHRRGARPATPLSSQGEGPGVRLQRAAQTAIPPSSYSALCVNSASSVSSALKSASAVPSVPPDPLALLAEAAGYSDHELWWERSIEQRRDATGLFDGILEAMTALRDDLTPRDDEEAQREAHMRQFIRAAEKEGFERIAVVCGAWHVPALQQRDGPTDAKADAALLAGLKRVKVAATWIPWTNSRLAYRSGYGAGITSPGWYGHLWAAPDRVAVRWASQAAQLLREEGLDASSASVIEAVRLAEALAAMDDQPMPGMAEMHEAIQTVLCHGEAAPMQLIRDKLEIGEVMGEVPPETPAVPLQRDLEAQARRLLLKLTSAIKPQELDLRKDLDRARSRLLHRLRLLGIEWGKPQRVYGRKLGTFHENWQLQWQPEFAVALIERNVWGNTVVTATGAFAHHQADEAPDLPALTGLLDRVMLAELPDALDHLLDRVEARAAVAADVRHLMDALPPLANVARYGDVRGTRAERVMPIIDGLFARVLVGLPGACASLDDDAARAMVGSIDHVQETIAILNRDELRADWLPILRVLVDRDAVHGLVRGRCCRLLFEQQAIDSAELRRLAGLALSPAHPAEAATAWVEGVLKGTGLTLLQQDGLWRALDAWLADLAPDTFVALLPLLRRAFADFSGPERRAMGEKVTHLRATEDRQHDPAGGIPGSASGGTPANRERAAAVLPVLAQILGVSGDGSH